MTQDTLTLVLAALAPLLLVVFIDFLFLSAGHMAFRPEMQKGRLLPENVSRAIGVSTILASLLALELWRAGGFGGTVHVGWLWIDAAAITAVCGVTVIGMWRWKGDPRQAANTLVISTETANQIVRAAQEAAKHGK